VITLLIFGFLCNVNQVRAGCCQYKIVDSGLADPRDGNYTLYTTSSELPAFCQDDCVYNKNGEDPEELYCFGDGDLDSQCYAPLADPTIPPGEPEPLSNNDDNPPPGGYYFNQLPGNNSNPIVCGALFEMVTEDRMTRFDLATMGGGLVPASHSEWSSTGLYFERIDGASSGDVQYDHLVGIFADTDAGARYRLEVKNSAGSQSSTQQLKVTNPDGSACSGNVAYGTEYALFTNDGTYRLDIGDTGTGNDKSTWMAANGGSRLHLEEV